MVSHGVSLVVLFATASASTGCTEILGIDDHGLADDASLAAQTSEPGEAISQGKDSGSGSSPTSVEGPVSEASVDADSSNDGGSPSLGSNVPTDPNGTTGDLPSPRSDASSDGYETSLPAVALATLCSSPSGDCVLGGILSVDGLSVGTPSGDGGAIIDNGFELGARTCDGTGMICVTGGITP